MAIEPDNKEFENVEKLINQMVQIDFADNRGIDLLFKLDVLDRTIELLRIRNKNLKNNLPIEDYVQGNLFVDSDSLRFSMPERYYDIGTGIHPIQLQPKLLLFLLLFHKEEYRVLDIIKHFINKLWDEFDPIDFKKTETGVFRCFTNTRFAAKTLRAYGLLKFTQKEAYKTWVLSLPGFLVASVVLDKHSKHWGIPQYSKIPKYDLHEDIWKAWDNMNTYDDYLQRLTAICKPNADIFKTFKPVLEKAYMLLEKYWKLLCNQEMTINERHEASIELLGRVEELPSIEQFYVELSKSLNLDRFLKEL